MTMLKAISQIVLLLYIQGTIAQERACEFTINDSRGVFCDSINGFIDAGPEDRFFGALKNIESQGDFCGMSEDEDKIGLYHISEEYYNQAVCFNEHLKMDG